MKIGLALFPGLCQLDMTGPHEVMARYPGAELSVVAATMIFVVLLSAAGPARRSLRIQPVDALRIDG